MTSASPLAQYLPCLIIHEIVGIESHYYVSIVPKRKNQISNQSRAVTSGGHLDFRQKFLITRHI